MLRIRRTTIAGVGLLALIAGVVSFRHMHELCMRHGEDQFAAVLIPLAVDGLIVVASMSILLSNQHGARGGFLAWTLLVVGSLASLGANVAVAEPTLIGRIIAAWPSLALIGSYELLMSQIRRSPRQHDGTPASSVVGLKSAADTSAVRTGQEDDRQEAVEQHLHSRMLQREAWQWVLQNRLASGDLPSGIAIARAFGRSARWGRLVKKAGLAGELSGLPAYRHSGLAAGGE